MFNDTIHFIRRPWTGPAAALAALIASSLPPAPASAQAAPPALTCILARFTADESKMSADEDKIAALQSTVNSQAATIQTLQSRGTAASSSTGTTSYGPFTVTGSDVYLTGYNLHVLSGSGSTSGKINGLGNLILGYDESRGAGQDTRTGSHNLILGTKNNFSGYGGLVAGADNGITGGYTTVTGGYGNRAIGTYSSVSGGQSLTATAAYDLEPAWSLQAQVTALNTAQAAQGKITGLFSLSDGVGTNTEMTLTGVNLHLVNGMGGTETKNGLGNLILGYDELRGDGTDVRTGSHNVVTGVLNDYVSFGGILGGYLNSLDGPEEFAVGAYNTAVGNQAAVSGGYHNAAGGNYASISGGSYNTASGYLSAVSGGYSNTAGGPAAAVCGGFGNTAGGDFSAVSGGYYAGTSNAYGWTVGINGASVTTYEGNFVSP